MMATASSFLSRPKRAGRARIRLTAVLAILAAGICLAAPARGAGPNPSPAPSLPQSLKGITLEDAMGEFTLTLWTDPPIADYHLSYPRNPDRFAIDLPGRWARPEKTLYRLSNDTVKHIAVTHHPDRLRVFLYLKHPDPLAPYIYESLKGLVLRLKKTHLFHPPPSRPVRPGAAAGKSAAGADNGAAYIGALREVKIAAEENGFTVRLVLDGPPAEHAFFTLLDESPPKLVLDIKGRWRNPGPTARPSAAAGLRGVRVGEHAGFLRVVMDLAEGAAFAVTVETAEDGLLVRARSQP